MRQRIGPFRALDFVFDIKAPSDIASMFVDCLDDLRTTGATPVTIDVRRHRHDWSVRSTSGPPRRGLLPDVVAFVIDVINHGAVSATSDAVSLHAASVVTPRGVLAFSGPSEAGKSTLAAAMVQQGAGYLTDEVTTVRADLTVRAFHRPIGLRQGGANTLGIDVPRSSDDRFERIYPWRPPPASLAGDATLAGICIVEFSDQAPSGRTEVRPAEALVVLAAAAFGGGSLDDRQRFRDLAGIVHAVPVVRLSYADPTSGVEQVQAFIERLPAFG